MKRDPFVALTTVHSGNSAAMLSSVRKGAECRHKRPLNSSKSRGRLTSLLRPQREKNEENDEGKHKGNPGYLGMAGYCVQGISKREQKSRKIG